MRKPGSQGSLSSAAYAAIVLAAIFIFGLGASLAGRDPAGKQKGLTLEERFGPDSSYDFWQRTRLPRATERGPGLSPFGDAFKSVDLPRDRRGLVATPLGFVDLKQPRGLEALPPGLRRKATHTRAGRGGIAPGANLIQVSADAISDLGIDEVERRLGASARVVGTLPERAFLVRAHGVLALQRLADLPFIEAMQPYHPGLKIDRTLGRTPMIQRNRAQSSRLDLMVAAWPGAGAEEIAGMRRDLEALAGSRAVSDYSGDGRVLRVEAEAAKVAAIAAIDAAGAVQEVPEYLLANSEASSTIMTGSVEDTLGARPYHDIGIDGGGIDTNGDGQRINNGTDSVPPQIVAVTDNGLSSDSAQFSETATQVFLPQWPIGSRHRKVHAVQTILDNGDTCDGALYGSGTHGNVVAGASSRAL